MDHTLFDRFSQTLADSSRQSRRGFLAALGIAVIGTITSVESAPARRKGKAGHHARGKRRHQAKSRQPRSRGRVEASAYPGELATCKSEKEVGAMCDKTHCHDASLLQPPCTCTGTGQCTCPSPIPCPGNFACQYESCLTQCLDSGDCGSGYGCAEDGTCRKECTKDLDCNRGMSETCQKGGLCGVGDALITATCSNFNYCSGHGACTNDGICLCDKGWHGVSCDISAEAPKGCPDYTTSGECGDHRIDGCVWCSATLDGYVGSGVCTTVDNCASEQLG